ncbi:MAG: aminotransferase class I/II-fold pyridoxal phosphate-dependent enzyme, partial [Defluviitaleaceae bacterium]|nr:aminotransferase class I/II-fold pyridoxal phosphate-dependent enzyme [Defluviitaleaceae bacterium]
MMKQVQRADRMANVRSDIRGAIYDESMRMKAQGIDVLRLNTGNPGTFDFPMPDSVRQALLKSMEKAVPYTDSKGDPGVRQAIADYHNKVKGFPTVSPENDIYVGNGVSELAQMAMLALLNPGDEILVPMPNYPVWSNAAYIAGAQPVHYMCDEQAGWMPDVASIRANVTSRTKAILIINPNNPTGVLYSKEVLLDVLQVARENNLVVFADEIYDRIVMDELTHHSCGALAPDLFVVTTNGLSKSHIICGFRSGWMVFSGPTELGKDFITGIHQQASMRLCPNTLAQFVIPAALTDDESTQAMVRPGGRLYE